MATDDDDEPRAKDLFTRSREELEEAMDPATLAQLESWFDMPNLAAVADAEAEEKERVEARTSEERELEQRLQRQATACAAVDPAFQRHIERHDRTRIRLAPDFDLEAFIDESIVNRVVRAQLDRQGAEEPVADVGEYQQPPDVEEIVARHNAPQAILRDLYRPVREYEPRLESPFSEEDMPLMDPSREVREALREHIKVEWVEPGFRAGVAAKREGKAILREPWAVLWDAVQEMMKARGSW